jgi:hypothetical protein
MLIFLQIDPQFERISQGYLTEALSPIGQPSEDTGLGADMEAEQQLHFEANVSNDALSVSNSPTVNNETNADALTEPSPAVRKPGQASRKRQAADQADGEEDGER